MSPTKNKTNRPTRPLSLVALSGIAGLWLSLACAMPAQAATPIPGADSGNDTTITNGSQLFNAPAAQFDTDGIDLGAFTDTSGDAWTNWQQTQVDTQAAAAAKAAAKAAAVKKASAKAKMAAQAAALAAISNVPIGTEQSYAIDYMANTYGWTGKDQQACLLNLWQRESGWSTSANNTSSGAYGIPQALPGTKMATIGDDWQTNYKTQIKWGLLYINGSYGTPCNAWAHSNSAGWY